jgi:hypothetical protein
MSYLHCPTCQRAYNVATQSSCPFCPVAATLVDPTADIVNAAEQLARAVARANPSERDAAAARMERLALPERSADGSGPHRAHGSGPHRSAPDISMLRQIRNALAPEPPPPPPPQPLLVQVALAVLTRIETRLESRPRLRRATDLIRARVRALAA